MRILHVVPEMDPHMGGVCQAVRTIVAGLAALGMGVVNEVVSMDAPDAPFLRDDQFPVHALGSSSGPWRYNGLLRPWLVEHLPRFDVVVVHGLWLYYGYAVRQALRQLRTATLQVNTNTPRLYVMPHGMLDPYFQRAAGRKIKAVRNTLYWKLLERQLLHDATAVLFTCEEELRLAQQSFRPYQPQRTFVVGLGVEEPPMYEATMQEALLAKCPTLRGQPYLLFLSRIHEKKGVDLLLKAYQELSAAKSIGGEAASSAEAFCPKLPTLVVAGPGLDTSYGRQIQTLVAGSSALQSVVLFPGMLSGAAKWGAFYGCEAFILPSHQENFGIAVVEALACQKPVLISNQVNIWREIEASGGGLVAPDTPAGTYQLLARWEQTAPADQVTLQQRARATFELEFAVGPAAKRFLRALQA